MSTTHTESADRADVDRRSSRVPRWVFVLVGSMVALTIVAVAAWTVSLPYFSFAPGPVTEVNELIIVEGEPIAELDSELYMLTVSIGTHPVNVYEYLTAQLDPTVDLVPRELVRPRDISYEEYRERNANLMDESVNLAIAVALEELGYDVEATGDGILVVDVLEDAPADGVLQADDIIVEINGRPVELASDGVSIIQSFGIGETIQVTVLRGDERLVLPITLIEHVSEPGSPMVGFIPDTANARFDFPVDVKIESANAIGPSAGLVYTLAVINALTPEDDLMKGQLVAGTGTIQADGTVGAIGGIRQKVVAAEAAGATILLLPFDNYTEALTSNVDGIELVPVRTVQEAVGYLEGLPAS